MIQTNFSLLIKTGVGIVAIAAVAWASYLSIFADRHNLIATLAEQPAHFARSVEQPSLQKTLDQTESESDEGEASLSSAAAPLPAFATAPIDTTELYAPAVVVEDPAHSGVDLTTPFRATGGAMSTYALGGLRVSAGFALSLPTMNEPQSSGSAGAGSGLSRLGASSASYFPTGGGGGSPSSNAPSTNTGTSPGTRSAPEETAGIPGNPSMPAAQEDPFTGTNPVVGDLLVPADQVHSPGHSPGQQTISGNYFLDGTLRMELAGTEPGTEYDQLVIGGDAFLNGIIEIVLLDDFVPEIDDVFDILIASNFYFGNAFQIIFPDLTGGHFFSWSLVDLRDGRTAFRIVDPVLDLDAEIVPAPATLALFGLGLTGIGFIRRRRDAA